jgi:predicted metal-dependent HD superfamily phosphohydrolase
MGNLATIENVKPLAAAFYNALDDYTVDEELRHKSLLRLLAHYKQKHRHYHNLSHIASLMRLSERFEEELDQPNVLRLAILYHDIIYRPPLKNNEERSARYAEKELAQLGLDTESIALVAQYIRATTAHECTEDAPKDLAWFLDFDLAILASTQSIYLEYARNIRKEYWFIPGPAYRKGRRQILEAFLNRPFIYFTEEFREQKEEAARSNIMLELEHLPD